MWFPLIGLPFFFSLPCYPLLIPESLSSLTTSIISSTREGRKANCCLGYQAPAVIKSMNWHLLTPHCPHTAYGSHCCICFEHGGFHSFHHCRIRSMFQVIKIPTLLFPFFEGRGGAPSPLFVVVDNFTSLLEK